MRVPRLAKAFFLKRSEYFSRVASAMRTSEYQSEIRLFTKTVPLLLRSVQRSGICGSWARRLHPGIEDGCGVDAGGLTENFGEFVGAEGATILRGPLHEI